MIRSGEKDRYFLRDNLTISKIKKFYNDWKKGELKPFMKSEEEVEEHEDDLAFNLVGTNYMTKIHELTQEKDGLVLFYMHNNRKC